MIRPDTIPLRFGIVGTGRMAARIVGSFSRLPGVDVIAVASDTPGRANAFARKFGMEAKATIEAMLTDADIDAVYVATRNEKHAGIAVAALRAGKAVLCEKPTATTPDEAALIVETARATGTLFMEAICTPFLPAFARAVALAGDGSLGRPTHLRADFGFPASAPLHPGIFRAQGGGVLLDRLVYPLALALAVFGPVAHVGALVVHDAEGVDVEASVVLDHHGGGRSELSVSLLALSSNSAMIACPKGRIGLSAPLTSPEEVVVAPLAPASTRSSGIVGGLKRHLRQFRLVRRLAVGRGKVVERHPFGRDHYVPELAHFCALLREGRGESDVVTFAVTTTVQRVIAAVRAAGAGCTTMSLRDVA